MSSGLAHAERDDAFEGTDSDTGVEKRGKDHGCESSRVDRIASVEQLFRLAQDKFHKDFILMTLRHF